MARYNIRAGLFSNSVDIRRPDISALSKEKRFLDALESLFTGAAVEGDSGYVNLMRIKHNWFCSIRSSLMDEVDKRVKKDVSFREELFDKLYTFFNRYFCESGSIYFRHLPAFARAYERVYEDGKDLALSWKTRMLYYVKSDLLVRSMPVELSEEGKPQKTRRFYFDASGVEHKQNNEKREFVFAFDKVENGKEGKLVRLTVSRSQNGRKTKTDEILGKARKAGVQLSDEQLKKALAVFRRQTEVDFFINKNARGFLREQFDLWVYQYIFQEETIFEEQRIKQIQTIKEIAYNVIDFIAQFEDELRRVWEKPKFVRGVNYVLTLDKLTDKTLKKISGHEGAEAQIKEWRALGMVDDRFSMKAISKGQKSLIGKDGTSGACKFLPLDTKHFKDIELEILNDLGNLDEALDGELVHSENWQALNTLQKRYKEKAECVYIDPPYNTGTDFEYKDRFQDSSWLTLMENRLEITRGLLKDSAQVYLQLDHYADYLGRILLQNVFPYVKKEDQTVITWNTGENISGFKTQKDNWIRQSDKILFFPKDSKKAKFVKLWKPLEKYKGQKIGWLDFIGGEKNNLYIEKWQGGKLERIGINVDSKRIGTIWNDIYSFQYSEPRETESFSFQTQKPENLLRRIIQSCTHANDTVIDLFAGTGTTPATAQKIKRKWLAIENDKCFHNFYIDNQKTKKVGILGRMKIVLSGDKEFVLPNTPESRNPHLSKDVNWEGSGFFKYYALEQYEEVLKNSRYEDGEQLELDSAKSPFEQYVFFGDDKLAHLVKPLKSGKLKINLHDLYPDIDLAESLANVLGKQIRKRTKDTVTFEDGSTEKTDPKKMTEKEKRRFVSLIKPYLWWGE